MKTNTSGAPNGPGEFLDTTTPSPNLFADDDGGRTARFGRTVRLMFPIRQLSEEETAAYMRAGLNRWEKHRDALDDAQNEGRDFSVLRLDWARDPKLLGGAWATPYKAKKGRLAR